MTKIKRKDEPKEDIWQDPRFSHLVNDPRFKRLPRTERKVKIDKRFESMFNEDKFQVKYTVDKYGRRLNKTSSEDLKKYYELNTSDEEDEDEEIRKEEKQITKDSASETGSDDGKDQNDELEDDGELLPNEIKKKLENNEVDYARGEGRILTDSSSDEESSEDEDEVFIEHVWGELDNDAPTTEESTRRLAACNMDWDRIRAIDIMVLCNSFLPPGGTILSVTIYPSEFGKERMAEEDVNGPPELTNNANEDKTESDLKEENIIQEQDSDAEEGDDYHMEKLRQYQLNRLKYYYAVIECDSVATADKLYKECDGLEYESTATKLDLRFIPDDMDFDEDESKDKCSELPELTKYKPRLFTTTALQQAKVELTWDETNVDRKEISEKLSSGKLTDVSEQELRKFVAYSSEEDDSPEDDDEKEEELQSDKDKQVKGNKKDAISKYKSLLEEINKNEDEKKKTKCEMEYTWGINVNSKSNGKSKKKPKELTPIEKALEKKREKNKKRKEERKMRAKMNDDEDEYSSDDLPDGIDLNDPYFAEEFNNGDFEPKKLTGKSKEKQNIQNDSDDENEQKTKELELLLDDGEDDKHHFSLKKIQDAENETKSKKRRNKIKISKQEIEASKVKTDDGFEVKVNDSRFGALFTSHEFNIDPTDSHFKKTKGMETIIQEKLKRRYMNSNGNEQKTSTDSDQNESQSVKRPRKAIENSMLIKNLKRKINAKQNHR